MMDTDLKINIEQAAAKVPVTVFHLTGWLDAQSESQLTDEAGRSHAAGARYILLNLRGVSTLTSAGMRAIQKIYKLFTPEGEQFKTARVKICEAPPQIYHVLGITGFLQNIPNYESQEAALDSFEA
jgi:anti-anti-sigma factor